MFGVGLQFHLEELLAVRRIALPGAPIGMAAATALGAGAARMFGWSWAAAIVFGLALSVASTVVLCACSLTPASCTRRSVISHSDGW